VLVYLYIILLFVNCKKCESGIYQQTRKMSWHSFKKRVFCRRNECMGLVTKENCISENNFFGNVILNPAKKGMYSCWEFVCWQSYFFCAFIALYVLSGKETDFCKIVSKAINIRVNITVDWNNYNYYLFDNRRSHDNQTVRIPTNFHFHYFYLFKKINVYINILMPC